MSVVVLNVMRPARVLGRSCQDRRNTTNPLSVLFGHGAPDELQRAVRSDMCCHLLDSKCLL